MKNLKRILIFSFFLLIASYSHAQYSNFSSKHTQGMYGLDLSYGISKNGKIIELTAIEFLKNNRQQLTNLSYESGSVDEDDYKSIGLNYLRQYTLYDLNEKYFLNGFGGATLNYEIIESKFLNKEKKSVVPGVTLGIEIEWYCYKDFVLVPKIQQMYKFNSNLGEFCWRAQIGIRYVF